MDSQQITTSAINIRWTLSNMLSLSRLIMVVPLIFTLGGGHRWMTVALCLVAAATDVLDGYFARRNNEISDLGKILDPLADKVFVAGAVIILLVQGALPPWFVIMVLARDLVIFIGGLLIEQRTGVVLPSNYPGKIAVLVLSFTLLMIIIGVAPLVVDILMGLSFLLLMVSLFIYVQRGVASLKTSVPT